MAKTIGIFGGAFDPVHVGHTSLISDIQKIIDFEKIFIIPSGKPVLKNIHFVDGDKRIEMLDIAFKKNKGVHIDNREVLKKEVSYTFETLREFHKEYKTNQHFSFILGQDAFANFKSWKNWEELLNLCSLIVIKRPNYFFSSEYINDFKKNITSSLSDFLTGHGNIFFAENLMLDISSSDIRENVYKSEFKEITLDNEVLDYIKLNSLYKN
ncbi:MAG: nicotinate (nicotinamide) nucleotide adenylyltransferase [Gammaproteobacteria bacterium]